jgi:hypothetical protein
VQVNRFDSNTSSTRDPMSSVGTTPGNELAGKVALVTGAAPDGRYVTGQSIHLNGGGFMP